MIRKSTAQDVNDIMEIWLSSNEQAHGFVDPAYWKSHYEDVKEAISEGVTVYEEQGKVCGFMGVMEGYVAGLFVKAGHRGRGIGAVLLNEAKQSNDYLSLHVFAENEGAVRFYERQDFRKECLQENEDCRAMEYVMQWGKLTKE